MGLSHKKKRRIVEHKEEVIGKTEGEDEDEEEEGVSTELKGARAGVDGIEKEMTGYDDNMRRNRTRGGWECFSTDFQVRSEIKEE